MVVVVRGFVTNQAQQNVERNTRMVADVVLAQKLRRTDFAAPVTRSRRKELDRLFARHVLVDGVERATLFTRTGVVSYSTDPALIGWRTRDSGEARRALRTRTTRDARGTGEARRARASSAQAGRPDRLRQPRCGYVRLVARLRAHRTLDPSHVPPDRGRARGAPARAVRVVRPGPSSATRQLGSHIDEIEHLALHDSLTGLPNRRLFGDRIEHVLADVNRTGGRGAVLVLDLDRFKEINDTLGHAKGDELLRAFSTRLRRSLRDTDTVARLGGTSSGSSCASPTSPT